MTRKVVVTGVSGGVGGFVSRQLIAHGWHVIGVSRSRPSGFDERTFEHHGVDLQARPAVEFGEIPLIHCAALTRDGLNSEIADANEQLTKNALSLSVGPVIHISSSSVYDLRKPTINASEDEATGNYPFLNAYSEGKWLSEQVVRNSGRGGFILRPHAVYGPGDTTLIPRLRKAVRFGRILLPIASNPVHQFTSMVNLANSIELALEKAVTQPETELVAVNVTDSDPTLLRGAVAQALGESVKISVMPLRLAKLAASFSEKLAGNGEPRLSRYAVNQLAYSRTYNLSKAQQLLGFAAEPTDFRIALSTLDA